MNNENNNHINALDFGLRTSAFGLKTPKELGYTFPAEWEEHEATAPIVTGKLEEIYPYYCQFINILSED